MRGELRKNLFITMVTFVFLLLSVSLSQAQVKPGDVIDSSNWQKAVDCCPLRSLRC